MNLPKVTVMGGGTGTFVVLSGLKEYPLDLCVVVAMTDSGGSTGKLRDQYGVLPPGDLRQCLVALSTSDEVWRQLFLYRFDRGDFSGHNFGNILLSTLEKISPSYKDVIKTASKVLNVRGTILPVTLEKTNLVATYENGEVLKGEAFIDVDNKLGSIITLSLSPSVSADADVLECLNKTDFIVIGPGDIYTSLIPCLLPIGITKATKKSKAKIIFVVNLMNKKGQTDNMTASQHVEIMEENLQRKIDVIVVNSAKPTRRSVTFYQRRHEDLVIDDLNKDARVIRGDLLSDTKYINQKGDQVKRSLLRHDPDKLAKLLYRLFIH